MKVIAISDTHGLHQSVKIPKADLLIHAGDLTEYGIEEDLIDFLDWFAKQPCTHKIFVGGNHDECLDTDRLSKFLKLGKSVNEVIYLKNSSITINGIKIWGSPVTHIFWVCLLTNAEVRRLKKYGNKYPKTPIF